MKPTTLIALIGLISGSLVVLYLDLNLTLIFSLFVVIIIFNYAILTQGLVLKNSRKSIFLFSIFLIFALFNTYLFQQTNNFNQLDKISNNIILGEIIQVKSNEDHYNTYQIKTQKYYVRNKEKKISTKLILICRSEQKVPTGHNILFKAEFKPFENEANPGSFDAKTYYKNHNFSGIGFIHESCILDLGEAHSWGSYFNRWQDYLGQQIDQQFTPNEAGVAKALILGDKNSIDPAVISSFSNTGAMHVLAVSGLHVGILLYILQFIFGLFYRVFNKRQALLLALVCIWIFTLLSGASPSVLRSAVMFSCISLGQLLYRDSNSMNYLFLSAILLLSFNPYYFFDIGFQLSYMALIGIFLFQNKIQNWINPSNKLIKWLWDGTAIGIAATLATTPLMLYYFHQFPNYFLLSNVSVMLLGFVLLLILSFFLIFYAVPFINWILALVGSWLIYFQVVSIQLIDELPGAVSSGFQIGLPILLISVLLIFTWNSLYNKKVRLVQYVGVFILFALTSYSRNNSIQNNQLLFINSTKLCFLLQYEGKSYCFYDQELTKKKLVQYCQNYSRFFGAPVVKTTKLSQSNKLKVGKHHLVIIETERGYSLQVDQEIYHYFTSIPDKNGKYVVLNSTQYKKFNGFAPFENKTIAL